MYKINLGCGSVFIDSPEWLNLDYSPTCSAVRRANLLGRLPLADDTVSLVYSSHFLEHVPRALVPGFLRECLRVLQPGGVVRLVVPDLENMAREYLAMRDAGEHDKANFVVLEMIDQCVRGEPGGELGKFYRKIASQARDSAAEMIDYIRARTGEDLRTPVIAEGGSAICAGQRRPCASRTLAWRPWASGTSGYGISNSSRLRSKPLALPMCNGAALTAVPWPTSRSSRSTWMPRASRVRGRNHSTWRRASPANAPSHCTVSGRER